MVTLANSGVSLTDASSHSKVGESGNSSDEESGGVHKTVSVRSALGRDEEENREAGHDEEDGPEVGVTPLSGNDGVLKVRRDGGDANIGLLQGVKDAVVVERVHCENSVIAAVLREIGQGGREVLGKCR